MATFDPTRNVWRLTATTNRPGQPRRRKVRDFHAPNTRAGRKAADAEEVRFRDRVAAEAGTGAYAGTFAQAAADWVNRNREDWSPNTVVQVEGSLRDHINPHIGATRLEAVTAEAVANMYAAWANVRRPGGYGKPTRRRWHGMVRAIFSDAMRLGRLERDPMVRVRPAGSLNADSPPTVPTQAEVEAAIAAAPSELARLFFTIAARTGARRDSILNLRWRDVNLDAATLFYGVTKENHPYTVVIDDGLVAQLRAGRKNAMETAMALGLGRRLNDLYPFSSDGGLTPWYYSSPSHAWRKAADAAGLADVRLHDLRHFHASQCLAKRFSHREVAARLGCTEANVLRTYSHLVDSDADHRIADMVGAMFADG